MVYQLLRTPLVDSEIDFSGLIYVRVSRSGHLPFMRTLKLNVWFQTDVQESGEEEINRELQSNSIHNDATEHKPMDFLWTPQARWSAYCHSECCWCCLAIRLCHSVSHLCSKGYKGKFALRLGKLIVTCHSTLLRSNIFVNFKSAI